ncbi:MAG TPA: hypothetical protein VEM14_06025 [Gemmatimonadaceae bacterium]|nr:hypothetical protein [Gemmatimonadaceae bacterium]
MKTVRLLSFVPILLAVAPIAIAIGQVPELPVQIEGRLDGIFARTPGVEAGLGFTVPSGIYVRSGLVAGLGAGRHGVEGRTDFVARFSFDPFRQSRWAPYAGGGVSGRYRSSLDGGSRAYLLILLGVEGPLPRGRTEGWAPAVEVGLGGGARIAIVIRRGINSRR